MAPRVAVVIPCFKVRAKIEAVLSTIGPEVAHIYVIDDCCPEQSGQHVSAEVDDHRVTVLHNSSNLGVGGATLRGYRAALEVGADIIVKMDGDGQMDGAEIAALIQPIARGLADYAKGNRFYDLTYLKPMPIVRLIGNSVLSLITKVSSGYWNSMDPTNGFTAIHRNVLLALPLDSIESRYFFESDMLYRLNLLRAVVWDVPMTAKYRDEVSNLKILWAIAEFSFKHFVRTIKRIFYTYYLRDFQVGSILLILGVLLSLFGVTFGSYNWYRGVSLGVANTNGTVMLAALPCLVGLQMLLTFISADINSVPTRPIHPLLCHRPPGVTLEQT